jgi:hypothetical protein
MTEMLVKAMLNAISKADSPSERIAIIIMVTGLSLLLTWASIHVEMYLYEKIIIDAMGVDLDKISFWQMLGLNVFVYLLSPKNNTSRGDK